MESRWVQILRSIARNQQKVIVDATIDKNNHILLKTRDGSDVDAGFIKEKPHGAVVFATYYNGYYEPNLYFTREGLKWVPATTQGKRNEGPPYDGVFGCWTGDRFLLSTATYTNFATSTILQSFDGATWAYHPDNITFNSDTAAGSVNGMAASGTGLVVVVGSDDMGDDDSFVDSNIAISRDFGETWEVYPYDDALTPFYDEELYAVAIKNDKEFIVYDGDDNIWYTEDGGGHWSSVPYPEDSFNVNYDYGGMKYFNGCWWLYGYGYDEWDVVMIKSDDLINWETVPSPWDGNYPPGVAGLGYSFGSGDIYHLEHDPLTNTVIAVGYGNGGTYGYVMMSTNGGDDWFEIGYVEDKEYAETYGFEGIYNWRNHWSFGNDAGVAYGYGWWFLLNPYSPSSDYPSMFRISPDGKITEPIIMPNQIDDYGYTIFSGGDLT